MCTGTYLYMTVTKTNCNDGGGRSDCDWILTRPYGWNAFQLHHKVFLSCNLSRVPNHFHPARGRSPKKSEGDIRVHFRVLSRRIWRTKPLGGPTNESMMGTRGIRHPRSLHLLRLDFGSRVWWHYDFCDSFWTCLSCAGLYSGFCMLLDELPS